MFDATFFKFLIAFIIIIALSFLVMGIAGGFNMKTATENTTPETIVK